MIPQEVLDLFADCDKQEHTAVAHTHGSPFIYLRKSAFSRTWKCGNCGRSFAHEINHICEPQEYPPAFAQSEPEPCDAGVRYGNCACHAAPSSVRCPCCDNDYEKCPCECSLHYAQDRCPVCLHDDKRNLNESCGHYWCRCPDSWHRDRSKP